MNPPEEKTELRTVDDFIAFFSAIPAKRWAVSSFCDMRDRRCALGHLGATARMRKYPKPCIRLHKLVIAHFGVGPMMINDQAGGPDHIQTIKTPKARILAALNEIKANQEKKS